MSINDERVRNRGYVSLTVCESVIIINKDFIFLREFEVLLQILLEILIGRERAIIKRIKEIRDLDEQGKFSIYSENSHLS
ncbi:MAG: hypothetical protein ACFE9Z_12195 [Promethearchaeota archaeon]